MNEINPKECLLELTHRCSLSCSHCFVTKNKPDLSMKDLLTIFSKLKKLGIENIVLVGGEPTMSPHFKSILDFCMGTFKTTTVETNATQKTEFFRHPSCKVAISLEYSEKEKNDAIRKFPEDKKNKKKSHFEYTIKKIKTIHNPKILRFSLYQDTNIFKCLVMADMYGCNSIFFPLIPLGSGKTMEKRCPDARKIAETLQTIKEFNKKSKYHHELSQPQTYLYDIKLYLKFAELFKERFGICQAGKRRVYVCVDGTLTPCPFVPVKIGNILKDSVTFIKKELHTFNMKMKKKKPAFPCSDCFLYKVCSGGCTAYHYNRAYKFQPNCPVNFLIKNYRREVRNEKSI